MLRMKNAAVAGVTLAALLAGVTACTKHAPSSTPVVSSAPVSVSASPSPTPVASFPAAPPSESEGKAAVRAAWQHYRTVMDSYYKNPSMTMTEATDPIFEVAAGDAIQAAAESIAWMRQRGIHQVGDSQFRAVVVTEPVTNEQGTTVAQVSYCHDPAHRKMIVVKTGAEDDNPNAKKTLRGVSTMELFPDGKWRVTAEEGRLVTC